MVRNYIVLVSSVIYLCSSLFFSSCTSNNKPITNINNLVAIINYACVQSIPHDTTSFTEGFLVHDGELFESTGGVKELSQTKSLFGVVDFKTGKIQTKVELDKKVYFGEGITFLNGKVFQLTYKNKIGIVYDAATYKKIKTFALPCDEGWGLTTDCKYLILSNGTSVLFYIDPNTLVVVKKLKVTENGYLSNYINELEYIKGYIYANIWGTNEIVKIEPKSGEIVGKLNLTSLYFEAVNLYRGCLEMNGIAYDAKSDKIYITGKMWPRIYEIKFNH